jgi:hypothetical protein
MKMFHLRVLSGQLSRFPQWVPAADCSPDLLDLADGSDLCFGNAHHDLENAETLPGLEEVCSFKSSEQVSAIGRQRALGPDQLIHSVGRVP